MILEWVADAGPWSWLGVWLGRLLGFPECSTRAWERKDLHAPPGAFNIPGNWENRRLGEVSGKAHGPA